jgi:succinate dehydrogenase/fumarate reductase flavoprotein subunit
VYETLTHAGFDPNKDMLQAPIVIPDVGGEQPGNPIWRHGGGGSVVVDWDLRTSLEGLYAAGNQIAGVGAGGHPGAAATGRYAGRRAAAYAKTAAAPVVERSQIDAEKQRVYRRTGGKGDIGWKELHAGIARTMQVYCPEYKSERMLQTGLWWLNSIRESEAERTYVRNPHELVRYLECLTRITFSEMIIYASLARKASSRFLGFKRVDYPQSDPPEWNKYVTLWLEDNVVKTGELARDYWLKPPYAPTYRENYEAHSGLDVLPESTR